LRIPQTQKPHPKFFFEKSGRQDRRRSDKYEVITENTNNPNTAKPRIITTIGSPPNTYFQSKPPAIFQPFLCFNLASTPPTVRIPRTTFLPSE
jgi:hypothetical protein